MVEIWEINKTFCDGVDNNIDEKRKKVLDTICFVRTEKRKIATFGEALEKSGIIVSGMTEKIKEELTKKWERGEPILVMGKKLDIPGKEEKIFEEIKCDINRIGEVKGYIEDISMLKNTKEMMRCK